MNRMFVIALFICLAAFPSVGFSEETVNPSDNPAQKLFQDRVGKIQWKDLAFEFRPVSAKESKGFQPMVVQSSDPENGKTYFVGKKPILGLKEINNLDVSYNPADVNLLRLIVRFNKDGKDTLQEYTTAHLGEMMGVLVDGKLRLVAHIRQPLTNGRVQVYGISPNEAVDIARRYYFPKLELARQIEESQKKK